MKLIYLSYFSTRRNFLWCEHFVVFLIFIFNCKMEEKLLQASQDGNLSKVSQILKTSKANINCRNIWIQKSFMILKIYDFILFQFKIIFGIEIQYLILLLWFWLHKMVIPKLSTFYYHNLLLKSTAKTFEYKNHSSNLNWIISSYFHFKSFLKLNSNI